jgi:outer membrane protein OmpA-like peptidoglycan-associated protein
VHVECQPCTHPQLSHVASQRDGALSVSGTGLGLKGKLTLDDRPLHVRSWTPTRIEFQVEQMGSTGSLVADCGHRSNALQLAPTAKSQPLRARVSALPVRARSRVFRLDAGQSRDPNGHIVTWRWRADHGRIFGADRDVAVYIMPRSAIAANVSLAVTDAQHQVDTETLTVRPDAAIISLAAVELFDTGSYRLSDVGRVRLHSLGRRLDGARSLRVVGHADEVGSEASNRVLSRRRASAVYDYLLRGVARPPQRRVRIARGEMRPTATTETSSGRERNRRVTVLIRLVPPNS